MNVKAPKAPPTMGPNGSFESDFPCNTIVTTPGAADVILNKEDFGVEEDSSVKNSVDEGCVANNEGCPVDGVVVMVLVVELRNKVLVDREVIKIPVVRK